MRHTKKQKGQTMIETVVAIGVAVIIIGALVTLINASNRRATLARQSTQASKLAQEGMEIVRNIRDVGASGAVKTGLKSAGSCTLLSPCTFSELYGATQHTLPAFLYPPDPSAAIPVCNAGSWCLVGSAPSSEISILGIFSRSVEINDDADLHIDTNNDGTLDTWVICSGITGSTSLNTKRITVRVAWESPIGHQERTVTSCLTKWL